MRRCPNAGQRIDSKTDAHEMAHGRPVQITEHTTATELQPSLSDVVCANKSCRLALSLRSWYWRCCRDFVARPHFADTKTFWDSTIEVIDQRRAMFWRSQPRASLYLRVSLRCRAIQGTPVAGAARAAFGNLGMRLPCSYLEIFAHDFMVGWLGHLNPVCAGALCGVARHSRALEHERRPAPRGDSRAGGRHDRNGLWCLQAYGCRKKVDETYRGDIEAAEQKAADAAGAADSDSPK